MLTYLNPDSIQNNSIEKIKLTNAFQTEINGKQATLVSGTNIKTINGESILGEGNITISGGSSGATYTAGTNIDITNGVISVTGITVPTKTSDLTNDSGFLTNHQSLSAYSTTSQMNSAISTATNDMATQTWVGNQGFLKTESEPSFNSSAAKNITSANITSWNSKQDAISDLATIRRNASNVPFIIQHIPASGTYTLNGTANHTYQYMIFNGTADYSTLNVQLASDSATNSVDGWQHYLLIYNNTGHNLNIVMGRGMASTKSIAMVGHAQQIELAWMIHYETNKYNYVLTISDVMTWLS